MLLFLLGFGEGTAGASPTAFSWFSVTQTVIAGTLLVIAGALIRVVPKAVQWFRRSDERFRDLEYARYRHGRGLRRVEDHLERTSEFRRWYDPEPAPTGTTQVIDRSSLNRQEGGE